MTRYNLTVADREKGLQKALSEQSRMKRREPCAQARALELEAVRRLREQGLVPLAIADALDLPDSTVEPHLRALRKSGEL